MFGNLFRQGAESDPRKEAKILFQEGMKCALAYDAEAAIDFYTRSLALSPNAAPLINRANLLGKRLRHAEALADLLEAKWLDDKGAREFTRALDKEITSTELITEFYRDGTREKLLAEFDVDKRKYIAGRIIGASFGISQDDWESGYFDRPMLEFHFFNELDNIIQFDNVSDYPDVEDYVEAYDPSFIDSKINQCPDLDAYLVKEGTLHGFLCVYDAKTMKRLRNDMLFDLHKSLMFRDYGSKWIPTFASDGETVIKEAANFTG